MHLDTLKVHFIDYGNKETISGNTAEKVDAELLSIPPLAESFVIAGLFPANGVSWTPTEYDLLQNKLLNAECCLEIIGDGVTGFPPLVKLLNNNFVSLSAPIISSLVSRWPSVQPTVQFSVGKSYTVIITHYESMLNFWVQLLDDQETLDRFHTALATSTEGGKSRCLEPKRCFPGTMCIARYKGSDLFYRAVVREVNWQGAYEVTFIDYGDPGTVKADEVWPIDEPFLKLPIQALRCCAVGQSAPVVAGKLRAAFDNGCTVCMRISAMSSVHHLVEVSFDVGRPIVMLPSPSGNAGVPSLSLPRYVESSLAEGIWHSVCISSVEPDGSFYVQRLADADSLNVLMVELMSMRLLGVHGAVVDGMACVVHNPADGCIYRAHVCNVSGLYLQWVTIKR